MAKSLLNLAISLERRVAKLDNKSNQIAVEVATSIVSDLILFTPVDTSKALSNWVVTLNNPVNSDIPPHTPGFLGYTAVSSQQIALRLAKQVLVNKKPGDKIYISNVADYIVDLNNGSSSQEPAGFVERAILIGKTKLKNPRSN